MSVLTFTEVIQPRQTPAGKWTPTKAKASDGKTYMVPKSAVALIENSLGTPLECETTSEPNGRWVNYSLVSARHILATTPSGNGGAPGPERPAPAAVPPAKTILGTRDTRETIIAKQSSLRTAVDALGPGQSPTAYLELAETFVNWVFEEEAQGAYDLASEVNRSSGGGSPPPAGTVQPATPATPLTTAQQFVQAAKEKARQAVANYEDATAVCPNCGRAEYLKQYSGGWFCAKSKVAGEPGGCGYPNKGERLDFPVSYGEWKKKQAAQSVPWKP